MFCVALSLELYIYNERLQQLGTEAWLVVKKIKCNCGENENIQRFKELAEVASNGLELPETHLERRIQRCTW